MKRDAEHERLSESDDPGEAALKQLFDTTVEEASGPTLTKLGARAGEVPERAQRVPNWLPRWAWSPTLAGVAVAAAVLIVMVGGRFGGSGRPSSSPAPAESVAVKAPGPPSGSRLTFTPPASDPTSMHLSQEAPDELDEELLDDEDAFAVFDSAEATTLLETDGDWFDLDGDPLSDPPSDDDLDAWLAATADLVEDG